ncbi:MAG: hypothetical protein IKS83_05050 [Victivallales bacterium]|nr:hypothetical protein [Victivallales bacterium]
MEISHPHASWTLLYENGRGTGPQKLQLDGKTLFSFMHCRIDDVSDDALESTQAHHFHKSGMAVFEGAGQFTQGAPVRLRQIHRIAVNTVRLTYDLSWPKATSLLKGLELGSVILSPSFRRFFVVTPESQAPQWRDLPAPGAPAVNLSPLPAAVVLENDRGQRFEYGLGDDLWRWHQGLNGDYLHATARLEISRTSGGRVALRRWLAECDSDLEAKLAEAANAKLRLAALQRANEALKNGEEDTSEANVPTVPVSQPMQRDYRFTAYFSWSAPELIPVVPAGVSPSPLPLSKHGDCDRSALAEPVNTPAFLLDLATLPFLDASRRSGKATGKPCWKSNQAQSLFRRIIRQLSDFAPEGTLILQNLAPGWCDTGTHENRKRAARHWDLCAILDQIAWARQILGSGWCLVAPQTGLWAELPSLSCLGAESGFRVV